MEATKKELRVDDVFKCTKAQERLFGRHVSDTCFTRKCGSRKCMLKYRDMYIKILLEEITRLEDL